MNRIHKILIANRGEIAIRIIRSAVKLGIDTVAVYSDADANALHKNMAEEAYPLEGSSLQDTYLNINKIISIAKLSNADAIHPGYGFLSENPEFAYACEQNNLIFIGPAGKTIQKMGNKIEARNIAKQIGIPVTESIEGSLDELINKDIHIPFPVLIKAASGGGGKGMKIVREPSELKENLESASREALSYFGDSTVFIEKFIENPRHIEVQILADNYGNCIHLYERECTIQRRHQKIIEEAPSPTLTEEVRQNLTTSALKIASRIGYTSAGTIEFLVDKNLNFYFLEMNTRIQVEHPVTEFITGIDLVEEQIQIAKGNTLQYKQSDIRKNGHAMECRVYAENPESGFLPSPGKISLYHTPVSVGVRIDSSIDKADEIRSEFDPMIAKLICHDVDRETVRIKIQKALDSFYLQGIDNNISYLKEICRHESFIENSISTSFCDTYTGDIVSNLIKLREEFPIEIIIGGFLLFEFSRNSTNNLWEEIGFWRDIVQLNVKINKQTCLVEIKDRSQNEIIYNINNQSHKVVLLENVQGIFKFLVNNNFHKAAFSAKNSHQTFATFDTLMFEIERHHVLHSDILYENSGAQQYVTGRTVHSPMFGKLVKINIEEGDTVTKGQTLLVLEAMKMENNIVAHKDGQIEKIHVKTGQMIELNTLLISFNE